MLCTFDYCIYICRMKKIRPFSNGTEFEMWDEKNCQICKNHNSDELQFYNCECHISNAFTDALFEYGEVNENIVNLIGFNNRGFLKDCPFKEFSLQPVKINTSIFQQLRLSL